MVHAEFETKLIKARWGDVYGFCSGCVPARVPEEGDVKVPHRHELQKQSSWWNKTTHPTIIHEWEKVKIAPNTEDSSSKPNQKFG